MRTLENIASRVSAVIEDIRSELADRLDGWLDCHSSPLMSLLGPPRCEVVLQPIPIPVERPSRPSTRR